MSINPEHKTPTSPNTPPEVVQHPDFTRDMAALNQIRTQAPAPENTDDVLLGRMTADERRGEVASKRKLGHLGVVGLGAAGFALTAGAFFGGKALLASGEDSHPEQNNSTLIDTNSQTDTESEVTSGIEDVEQTPVDTLEPKATTPGTDEQEPNTIDDAFIASINRDPSSAAIEYSLTPVDTAEFSEDEAVLRLLQSWKLYWLSGKTSQSDNISEKLTPQSAALGENQLDNIFGPADFRDEDRLLWDWVVGTREYLTLNMGYLLQENGYPEDSTFNSSFDILEKKDLGNGEIQYMVRNTWNSNMNDLNPSISNRDVDLSEYSTDRYITIGENNGIYHITEIRSRAAQ